jgi:3D-(3,5/4)-trihydroxycyclohexane-1,2-dione acylhydrolase (decyclizing)
VIHVDIDPLIPAPDSGAWWDVPVAAISELESVRDARAHYDAAKRRQRPLI